MLFLLKIIQLGPGGLSGFIVYVRLWILSEVKVGVWKSSLLPLSRCSTLGNAKLQYTIAIAEDNQGEMLHPVCIQGILQYGISH